MKTRRHSDKQKTYANTQTHTNLENLKAGLVASYDLWPGHRKGIFWKVKDRYKKNNEKEGSK